jgi:hypothetical protein
LGLIFLTFPRHPPKSAAMYAETVPSMLLRSLTQSPACGVANHCHEMTMTTRPGAQNAEAVLDIVVGYPLDEAREHFLG